MINIDDFSKVELKVGTVIEATDVEGSEKLVKLTVDLGEEKPRTILAGMKTWYKPSFFKGKQIVVVSNLESRKMMGFKSQGMILAAEGNPSTSSGLNRPILLKPSKKVPNGSKIR